MGLAKCPSLSHLYCLQTSPRLTGGWLVPSGPTTQLDPSIYARGISFFLSSPPCRLSEEPRHRHVHLAGYRPCGHGCMHLWHLHRTVQPGSGRPLHECEKAPKAPPAGCCCGLVLPPCTCALVPPGCPQQPEAQSPPSMHRSQHALLHASLTACPALYSVCLQVRTMAGWPGFSKIGPDPQYWESAAQDTVRSGEGGWGTAGGTGCTREVGTQQVGWAARPKRQHSLPCLFAAARPTTGRPRPPQRALRTLLTVLLFTRGTLSSSASWFGAASCP